MNPDRPLGKDEPDLLQRRPFARLVAKALFTKDRNGSTVIGVSGPWGSGKTSVAIQVQEEIGSQAGVVWFEPWMVSTSDALAREFFKVLGKALKLDGKEDKAQRAAYYTYAAQAVGVLSVAAEASQYVGFAPGKLASKSLDSAKKALEAASKGLEAQAGTETLTTARDELKKMLADRDRQIVFIIDDIDRLTVEEIRTVFQILKACADFPGVRYLLLFDREQVTAALSTSGIDGTAFLEKIVSNVFDLPEATPNQLAEIIRNCVNELPLEERNRGIDDRLYQLKSNVLEPGLTTVRQIKRYFGTVSALLPGLTEGGLLNVEPADFLALEYIRQFAPSLYSYLRREASPPVGGYIRFYLDKEKGRKDIQDRYSKAFTGDERLDGVSREALAILDFKIPNMESTSTPGWSPKEFYDKRFMSPQWQRVYLGFDAARAPMMESDWRHFVDQLSSVEGAVAWLDLLSSRKDAGMWVFSISHRTAALTFAQSQSLLTALLIWGERQPMHGPVYLADVDWSDAVLRIGSSILSKHEFGMKKGWDLVKTLTQSVSDSGSLIAASALVGPEFERWKRTGLGEWSGVAGIEPVAKTLSVKLEPLFTKGGVWELPDAEPAIRAYADFFGQPTLDKWFRKQEAKPETLAKLLNQFWGRYGAKSEVPNWGGLTPRFIALVRDVSDDLLDENGLWAKQGLLLRASEGGVEAGQSGDVD